MEDQVGAAAGDGMQAQQELAHYRYQSHLAGPAPLTHP